MEASACWCDVDYDFMVESHTEVAPTLLECCECKRSIKQGEKIAVAREWQEYVEEHPISGLEEWDIYGRRYVRCMQCDAISIDYGCRTWCDLRNVIWETLEVDINSGEPPMPRFYTW